MKAAVYEKYGPPEVLKIKEVPKPSPKKDEVLVKIKAAAVNVADWRMRKADPFLIRLLNGILTPRKKILGMDLAGEVEAVGPKAKQFEVGDSVFGSVGLGMGAYAEYNSVKEKKLVLMPSNISYEEAAAIPIGGFTALYYVRDKGQIQEGQKILIYGASGSVGTYAVQLAKYYGAEVTGVCSEGNFELVKSLGADRLINYIKEDFSQSKNQYDVIFDTVGKISLSKSRTAIAPNGKYLSVNRGLARGNSEKLNFLKDLIEKGKITPVIDKSYPLDRIVEAHLYVEQGHKRGNVVVTL